MGYNWEKIFQDKTSKELYDIVIGKVVLSKEARQFAKSELERRNFDFKEMEMNKEVWQLSELIDEENELQNKPVYKKVFSLLAKIQLYIFLAVGTVIIYFLAFEFTEEIVPRETFWFFIAGVIPLFVLLEIFLYKRRKNKHRERLKKIKELKNDLDKKGATSKNGLVYKELMIHKKQEAERKKIGKYVLIGLIIVAFIIYLFKMLS